MPRPFRFLLAAVVLAAAIVPYARTLDYDFVWDDGYLIGPQLDVAGPGDLARLWVTPFDELLSTRTDTNVYHANFFRPAVLSSLALDRVWSGENPRGFHLTNLLLYAGVCLFLWLFAAELSGRPVAAALGTVLFALHPAHPESVAFIAGRTDVQGALFYFAALWAAVRFGPTIASDARKLVPAALLLLPGLYAKEVVLFGAPVIVLALWIRDRRPTTASVVRAAVPVVAVCVFYLATRFAVLGPDPIPVISPVVGTTAQILTSVAAIARYLPLLFTPLHLSARHEIVEVHHPDLVFAAGLLVLAGIAAGLWTALRRRSAWSVPLALFATTLLPVCYVRLLQGALIAERFLFVPSAAVALAVALLPGVALAPNALPSERGKRGRAAAAAAAKPKGDAGAALLVAGTVAALWLAILLWPRVAVWRNEGTLFGSMLRDSPESPHVHAIVGGWYYRHRDLERSALHYRRAIDLAPQYAGEMLLNLGAAEDEMGQHDSSFVHIRTLIGLRPDFAPAWYAMGNLYVRVDAPDSAIAAYREALRLMPGLAQAENNLGAVYEREGRLDEALVAYRRALAAQPGYREATNNLRRLSAELGRPSGLDSLPTAPEPGP